MSSSGPRTPPNTIEGLKRLAKKYKKALGIPHHDALNRAAVACGFNNFRDAQRHLATARDCHTAPSFTIVLSAYWLSESGQSGLEVLSASFSKPLDLILTPREINDAHTLAPCVRVAADHLGSRYDFPTREDARQWGVDAARAILFMAEAEVAPATRQADRQAIKVNSLPSRDHTSFWVHRPTGEPFVLDEPYDYDEVKRSLWAIGRGLCIRQPKWRGLHNPRSSAFPHVIARNAAVCDAVVSAAERVERLGPMEGAGASFPYAHRYASPASVALQRPPRPREMPAKRGTIRGGAIAYSGVPGIRGSWRPALAMPIDLHVKAGVLLRNLHASEISYRALSELELIRYELDIWCFGEYGEDVKERHDPYFSQGAERLGANEAQDAMRSLMATLQLGYEDCGPRRKMIGRLQRIAAKL